MKLIMRASRNITFIINGKYIKHRDIDNSMLDGIKQ